MNLHGPDAATADPPRPLREVDTVDLGGVRLHVLQAYPGISGEGERIARHLARLDPSVVLGDLDIDDALRVREALTNRQPFHSAFVDGLFEQECARRFGDGAGRPEHPMVAAARVARDRKAAFVPLRPLGNAPGWIARVRGRRIAQRIPEHAALEFPLAFSRALREARVWDAKLEIAAAKKRLTKALTEGRAPVAAVIQAHRIAPFMENVHAQGWIPS